MEHPPNIEELDPQERHVLERGGAGPPGRARSSRSKTSPAKPSVTRPCEPQPSSLRPRAPRTSELKGGERKNSEPKNRESDTLCCPAPATPHRLTSGTTEVEQQSPGEQATAESEPLNRRRWLGLAGGFLASAIVFFLLPGSLPEPGKITAATAILMAVLWMSEAIPIPITALLPLIIFPLFSSGLDGSPITVSTIGASYGNSVMFLFMGGFMLALAMQRWNLHRRIALLTLKVMGPKPDRMIAGFMIATGFLSLWVSNTATAVMMFPIGISVIALVSGVLPDFGKPDTTESGEPIIRSNFATALLLGIAYAASIGSLGSIISTPPNTLLAGYMSDTFGIHIGFAKWMAVGMPISMVFMALTWLVIVKGIFRPEIPEIPGGRELIGEELAALGPFSKGERRVLAVFIFAASLWIFVPLIFENPPITDAGIAVIIGVLLFVIPSGTARGVRLLDWETAVQLPWGILLLFGGGLALSAQFGASGLTEWIGNQAVALENLPVWAVVIVITGTVLILSELTSNTATAATFLPVAGGIALGIGLNPMLLTIPVALTATCSFMLPVATPPNAIAFGSGYVKIGEMVKGGFVLNLIALVLVSISTLTFAVWVFGIVY